MIDISTIQIYNRVCDLAKNGVRRKHHYGCSAQYLTNARESAPMMRFTLGKQVREVENLLLDYLLQASKAIGATYICIFSSGITLYIPRSKPVHEQIITNLLSYIVAEKSDEYKQRYKDFPITHNALKCQVGGGIGNFDRLTESASFHLVQYSLQTTRHTLDAFFADDTQHYGVFDTQTCKKIAQSRSDIFKFNFSNGLLSTSDIKTTANLDCSVEKLRDAIKYYEATKTQPNSSWKKASFQQICRELRYVRWPNYQSFMTLIK